MSSRVGAIASAARTRRGWSQREAARRLACNHVHIGAIERGRKFASAQMMQLMAVVYGLDLDITRQAWVEDRLDAARVRECARARELFAAAGKPIPAWLEDES